MNSGTVDSGNIVTLFVIWRDDCVNAMERVKEKTNVTSLARQCCVTFEIYLKPIALLVCSLHVNLGFVCLLYIQALRIQLLFVLFYLPVCCLV